MDQSFFPVDSYPSYLIGTLRQVKSPYLQRLVHVLGLLSLIKLLNFRVFLLTQL
jgi:hypothetical protein